ncbi:hypothetical protein [Blastococcus deserti]|uniref:Uncharacterized protein n=1 Tax=Blastococcus deserti TaxID=2259033 RepID=A0ABW4XGM3_9ACTN
MTRLRGELPPVVSVACPLSADPIRRGGLRGAISRPDDVDR